MHCPPALLGIFLKQSSVNLGGGGVRALIKNRQTVSEIIGICTEQQSLSELEQMQRYISLVSRPDM